MKMEEAVKNNETSLKKKGGGRWGTIVLALLLIACLAGFTKWYLGKEVDASPSASAATEPPLPTVVVHTVERADLAIEQDYIGRVEAMQTVAIKPQVAGEIAQVHFTEGSIVKAGDLLFTLDSKQYQATVELRKADLAKAQANHNWAVKYYNRLKASDSRSVSASDLEAAENDVNQTKAAIAQANASLKLAQIDLGYTKITAPIAGQIGRALFTKGNYVTAATGELASIVQMNPIRVTFSMPDRDYLERIDSFKNSTESVYKTSIVLPHGAVYPLNGVRDFENNVMDRQTGTIQLSLRFQNEQGTLVPGTMVRVRTKPLQSHIAIVMPQEAILADAEGDYVYVVDKESTVHARRITLGESVGTMTEVLSGLEAGESIILRGIQSVRPNMRVNALPLKAEGEKVTPAELARESGYDLQSFSSASSPETQPDTAKQ